MNHGIVKDLPFDAISQSNRFYGMIETDPFIKLRNGITVIESGRHWSFFSTNGTVLPLKEFNGSWTSEIVEKLNKYFPS